MEARGESCYVQRPRFRIATYASKREYLSAYPPKSPVSTNFHSLPSHRTSRLVGFSRLKTTSQSLKTYPGSQTLATTQSQFSTRIHSRELISGRSDMFTHLLSQSTLPCVSFGTAGPRRPDLGRHQALEQIPRFGCAIRRSREVYVQPSAILLDDECVKITLFAFVIIKIPAAIKTGNSKPCRMSDTGNRHFSRALATASFPSQGEQDRCLFVIHPRKAPPDFPFQVSSIADRDFHQKLTSPNLVGERRQLASPPDGLQGRVSE